MASSRRRFLQSSGAVVALGLAGCAPGKRPPRNVAAPPLEIGKARSFQVGKPVFFHYPDDASPAIAVKLAKPVPGGAGPSGDIVAYSQLCVHKGCPVSYHAAQETFVCPCHYSAYDPQKSGQVIIGHATTNLPRIQLAYDASSDSLTASGVDGLIYGRFTDEALTPSSSAP